MAAAASEYELEALPELEMELESEQESEQFFGALANLARRGVGWVTTPGSPQRRFALWAARQAINRGLPALGGWAGKRVGTEVGEGAAGLLGPEAVPIGAAVGGYAGQRGGQYLGQQAASYLSGLLPQQEYEGELEGEISPIRRIYPDAMMEHLGHAAAETHSEAEAEALAGAMIPLSARVVPAAGPAIMRAAPGLICGLSGLVSSLRRSPTTRPLVRVVPAIVRSTAASIARQSAQGAPVTPQAAVRALASQTVRVLGSRPQAIQAFRRSRLLDTRYHRTGGSAVPLPSACRHCGAAIR